MDVPLDGKQCQLSYYIAIAPAKSVQVSSGWAPFMATLRADLFNAVRLKYDRFYNEKAGESARKGLKATGFCGGVNRLSRA